MVVKGKGERSDEFVDAFLKQHLLVGNFPYGAGEREEERYPDLLGRSLKTQYPPRRAHHNIFRRDLGRFLFLFYKLHTI